MSFNLKTLNILLFAFLLCCLPLPTKAQEITPDGTTATEINSADGSNFDINGGDKAGGNLFHSFGKFGVPTGGAANFLNTPDVENIINRVTGGNVSNIDGLIKANGGANLFLINPAGIIFGANARLDIGGSFLGSTADSLLFNDGTEFSAVNATGKPLLTINAPIGLNFRDTPGDIVNQSTANGNGLEVQPGKNITLVGGNINVDGGIIFAPGGGIELGGLAKAGQVKFNENGRLVFPDGVEKSDVSLTKGGAISIFGQGGGFLNINARNFELKEGSQLVSAIGEETNNLDAVAGDINISATENVSLDGKSSSIITFVEENAVGNAGSVNINTKNLSITNGAEIVGNISGQGNLGDININASDKVSIDGVNNESITGITSSVEETGVGNAGNIIINTKNLSIANNKAGIRGFVAGRGNTGDITINASDNIFLDATRFGIANYVSSTGVGNGGGISLNTKNLVLTNDTNIDSSVAGQGNAGDVTINASDRVSLDGQLSGIASTVLGIGNSGNININTKSLSLTNGSRIEATIFGQGNAGNININSTNNIILDGKGSSDLGSSISSQLSIGARGKGGNININTKNLQLSNDTEIAASTSGQGNAGSINIKTEDNLTLDNSLIVSKVLAFPETNGNDGNIDITADNIRLSNDSQISSDTQALGSGGNVKVNAINTLALNNSLISSSLSKREDTNIQAIGNAGSIDITTGSLFLTNGGEINAFVSGRGNGGIITIDARDSILIDSNFNNNQATGIASSVKENSVGNAGTVNINTKNLSLRNVSQIQSASQGKGDGGSVNINADRISIDGKDPDDFRSGIFSTVGATGVGNAGNITITAKDFNLTNGGKVSAPNAGIGNGGDIKITTNTLTLDGDSQILASTISGTGGNINLTVKDIISLRNNSFISAQATGDASGGNITIDAPNGFVVATPNQDNDIVATAGVGQGGKITINANKVYGFSKDRIQRTLDSEERNNIFDNGLNDINSSSSNPELTGSVNINTDQLDPAKKTSNTSQNVVEPDNTVAQSCDGGGDIADKNTFTITGRGGMPDDPTKPLNSVAYAGDYGSKGTEERGSRGEKEKSSSVQQDSIHAIDSNEIIPARGVAYNEKGQVVLTRYPTKYGSDGSRPLSKSSYCSDRI
jgi:filamentous hemagglutinin family protein